MHGTAAPDTLQQRRNLIELIYAAALDSRKWHDVASALGEAVGGHSATVFLRMPGTAIRQEIYRSEALPVAPDEVEAVVAKQPAWMSQPFAIPPAAQEITRRFMPFTVLLPLEQITATEYFERAVVARGIAAESPLTHVFATKNEQLLASVSLMRRADRPPFTAEQIAFADSLVPHFKRAHDMLDALRASRHGHAVVQEVIDRLPSGLILIDEDGRVLTLNDSARRSLEANGELSIRDDRLVWDDPSGEKWLQDAIRAATSPDTRQDVAVAISRGARARDGTRLPILVAPMLASPSNSTLPETAVLVFLGLTRIGSETAIELLCSIYDLTRAEAELAWLLGDGRSLEEAAAERGVTLNTARSQLKRVFAKTGATRQPELVRLVLASVGAMWVKR